MRWISYPGWPGNLLAAAAGALTTLALAPFDYWPLALLSLALYYLGLRELSPMQALGRGHKAAAVGDFEKGASQVDVHGFNAKKMLSSRIIIRLHGLK